MDSVSEEAVRACSPCLFHKANTAAQADLYRLEWDGVPAILKDYGGMVRGRPRWIGRLAGRFAVGRQTEALRRLSGCSGFPRLIGRVGRFAFLCEWVPGRELPDRGEDGLPVDFLDRLMRRVEAMHERGVAHGDLRRFNIHVSDAGDPSILDYETAVLDNGRPRSLRGRAFRLACRIDRIKVVRMKRRYFPESPLAPEEAALLADEPLLLRLARAIRQKVYRGVVKPARQRFS